MHVYCYASGCNCLEDGCTCLAVNISALIEISEEVLGSRIRDANAWHTFAPDMYFIYEVGRQALRGYLSSRCQDPVPAGAETTPVQSTLRSGNDNPARSRWCNR